VRVALVVAVAENGVIGRAGDLPWRLREDLRRFRRLTAGHVVIVGRRTQESIMRRLGGPLPGRRTIVLSRQAGYRLPGCETAQTLDGALQLARGEEEIYVIGGAEVYREALPRSDRIYLTRVHAEVDGDTFFPSLNPEEWRVTPIGHHPKDPENEYDCTFELLERRRPPELARHATTPAGASAPSGQAAPRTS